MPDNLKNALIRVYDMSMKRNHGNVVVSEVLFRRVEFPGSAMFPSISTPGAVLIDSAESLGPIADLVRRNIGFLVFIRSTDALLWVSVRADMMAGDYWTIELVPWIEYLRAASLPDDQVIREAHK